MYIDISCNPCTARELKFKIINMNFSLFYFFNVIFVNYNSY